jgi:hypothetical protein
MSAPGNWQVSLEHTSGGPTQMLLSQTHPSFGQVVEQ